jgi:hypothetical protein
MLWARRFGFQSKEEWVAWVDLGEKRTPYMTRDPEGYYTSIGQWRGWGHFLGFGDDAFEINVVDDDDDDDSDENL